MTRREYPVQLTVNGRRIVKVVIDPHYELKHRASIHDGLILELVSLLAGRSVESMSEVGSFQYFVSALILDRKHYRLIWLLENHGLYLGVANAYRTRPPYPGE
jgi:hypothetical protein